MKTEKRLLAALLTALLALALCSCGLFGGKGGDAGGEDGGKSPTAKAVELCETDEAYLKENGYTCYVYSSYLDSYAAELGADVSDLVRVTKAYNDDGDSMLVYYFKTEAQAKTVYEKDTSAYKLAGTRVVSGDPQNVIK